MKIFLGYVILSASFIYATTSFGQAGLDRKTLADRIVAQQLLVWPELEYHLTFDGCQIQVNRENPNDSSEDSVTLWLNDIETAPDKLFQDTQRMRNSDVFWTDHSVLYPWRAYVLNEHSSEISRFRDARSEIENVFYGKEPSSGFWDRLMGKDQNDKLLAQEKAVVDLEKVLHSNMLTGKFGTFFERNHGYHLYRDNASGLDKNFSVEEMFIKDEYNLGSPTYSPLIFVFRDNVVEQLLVDIHLYAQSACQ